MNPVLSYPCAFLVWHKCRGHFRRNKPLDKLLSRAKSSSDGVIDRVREETTTAASARLLLLASSSKLPRASEKMNGTNRAHRSIVPQNSVHFVCVRLCACSFVTLSPPPPPPALFVSTKDVAKCLLVCGVTYGPPPRPQSEKGSSPRNDPSSLAALAAAEVTALRFSRSREPDRGGGTGGRGGGGGSKGARRGEGALVLKVRPTAAGAAMSAPVKKIAEHERETGVA